MKTRTVLNSALIVAMIGYVIAIGVIRDPFLFIVFFPIVLLFALFLCIINIRDIKNIYIIFSLCFLFFFVGGWLINHYCLPGLFHPISLLGDVGILIFTVFLGWSLRKPHKKKILGIGTALFIVFIVLLIAGASITHKPSESPSSIDALKTLPYLSYVVEEKAVDKDGVVTYHQELCNPGINIYNSFDLAGAYLVDMSGKRLHTWLPKESLSDWFYVKMYYESDLLVSIRHAMLMRLDWDSHIGWEKSIRSHHDIAIAENNDIYALTGKDELVFISGLPVPILNDYIVLLSPDGIIKKEVSLFTILKREIPVDRILEIYAWVIDPQHLGDLWEMSKRKIKGRFILDDNTVFDIFHNNTLTIIDRNMDGLCKKGDILICVRQLDLIGIVDIDQNKLLWSWGPGNLEGPHHPTLLENGNILIFDNGKRRKYSRIIELNPFTKEVVWEYEASPPTSFFTSLMGAVQRLPNGNTLITESKSGRVFEITRDGEIVWEFYNPDRHENGKRAVIYRMMRITDPENYPKLKGLQ